MHIKQYFIRKCITIMLAAFILMTAPMTMAAAESTDEKPVASVAAVSANISPVLFPEENIRNSNTSITITLSEATWNDTAFASSDAVANFMKGFVAESQDQEWKLVQSAKDINITIDPTNPATLTLLLPPVPTYDITYDQIISVTIPSSFVQESTSDIYAGSFTIECDKAPDTMSLEDAIQSGALAYWLAYTSPYDVLINVPDRQISSVTISQQKLGNAYITIVDVTTTENVASVSVTWNNVTHSTESYIRSGDTRTFSVGFADIPPGADITIRANDKDDNPVQKDIAIKIKTGQTTYNQLPKSPMRGWYTLYNLITDSRFLGSVLSSYSLSELEIGVR